MDLLPYLQKLKNHHSLTESESFNALQTIFQGQSDISDVIELLKLLSQKGESVSEIVGFARAMRAHMVPVSTSVEGIDVCGTGGSGQSRFNISTAVAFLAASLGIPVAKHGNRGSRGPTGSFDFLEALGISFEVSPEEQSRRLETYGLCFLFARAHHPAMRYVAPARQQIGGRTIFNFLGPICNPASVPFQLLGTTQDSTAKKLGEALQILGAKRCLIVVGGDGLDELSIDVPSMVLDVKPDRIVESLFDPLPIVGPTSKHAILCPDAKTNADNFLEWIQSGTVNSVMKKVALNTAFAGYCTGHFESIEVGYQMAVTAIKDKTLFSFFNSYPKV